MKKDRFFWYFVIPWLLIITLFISLSPWLAEFFATPVNQVFTGINRWSTDYYIYLSYVEQGVRGFLSSKLTFTVQPHPAIYFYLVYTLPGYLFGHIFGLNSIFIYHLFRALYGLIFLFSTVVFFYKLSRSKIITLIAFIFTFYISGFVKIINLLPFQGVRYLEWLQEQNIIGRATGPLHYSVGFIIFISAFILYFYLNFPPFKKAIILGLLLNGLLLTNPFSFLLIVLCFATYLLIKLIFFKKNIKLLHEIIVISGAVLVSIPLFLLLNYYLSIPPWGVVGVSPKFYVRTTPSVGLLEIALSVGPIFFLGILGAIELFIKNNKSISPSVLIFLTIWSIIQFVLLIFGNAFKIHPARAFSGLYYLPLAYFSAQLINSLVRNYKKQLLIIFLLFLLTFPNYYLSYKEQLFSFTDFKYFSPFIYPSKKQVAAFKFLEKNTPAYSEVLALFEAGTLINGFSGNTTEVSIDQTFKIPFFSNKLNNEEAIKYLKKYHYKYVYFGYQEKFAGGDMDKYPFLKKIYSNEEVKIYQTL
ncbi:MAG: hypothetical protein WC741_03265 [Patescibacteria group bacterium]|jgi:hypothetical protein